MSDLQKRWAKAKMTALAEKEGGLPVFNELDEEDDQDQDRAHQQQQQSLFLDDDSASSSSSVSSTGTVIPSPSRALFARPQGEKNRFTGGRSLDPIPWTTYFERELFLKPDDDDDNTTTTTTTYHAYLTSPVGNGPLFVTHHGAGSSGLSFAVLSAEIRKRLPAAGILSLDARGHGCTTTPDEENEVVDLRLDTLATDLFNVIQLTKTAMKWAELPPIILVGHSLGGAVVTELARTSRLGTGTLLGYAVLDVVEGSAMDALQSMQTYLSTRPQGFATLRDGIDWHVRSRTIRNSVSARTSVPALLVDSSSSSSSSNNSTTSKPDGTPREEMEEETGKTSNKKEKPWRWRTDLAATQPFWEGWFVGLSKKFLGAKGGKMLLLAGTDRLDTELTIGQMQGKYALQVFPEAGHFIHEDLPEKTAIALVDFYRRNDRSAMVLPPKVSELLAQGKRV